MVREVIGDLEGGARVYEFDLVVEEVLVEFLDSGAEFFIVSEESISGL